MQLPRLNQSGLALLLSGCCALLTSQPAFAQASAIPSTATRGPALSANVAGTYTAPSSSFPDNGMPDAATTGNGDLALMVGGPSSALQFYFGKSDFWGVERGSIMPVGNLTLTIPALSGSSYSIAQNVGPATITGSFANGSSSLSMTSWVATSENTAVIQLNNTGSQALSVSSQLADGFANSAGNPATYGSSANSTWLNVSPDTVYLELGNQLHNVYGNAPFSGAIADLRVYNQALSGATLNSLDSNGAPTPILRWGAANPGTATVSGGATINPTDLHGGSVLLDGGSNSELQVGDLPLPENQFTFSTWMITNVNNGNGNIITAQIPCQQIYGSSFPYPYVRGLTLKLANGALSASLNQSGYLDFSSYYLTFAPDSNNQFSTTSATQVPYGQWVQVAATYDGNVLRIFLNGTQVGATASFPTGTTNGTMGWNKMVTHPGDTSVLYNDTAPQGVLAQSVLGATATIASQGNLSFSIPPGGTAYIVAAAVTNRNNANYLSAALTQSQQATASSIATLKQTHDAWWNTFWSKSFVQIQDKTIQDSWYASLYLLACCSTPNSPAPGLWGNFISQTVPAFQGDYTLDYNYEAPFWGAMASNHMELADNYDQPLLDHISRGRATGQYILGINGIYSYTHMIPAPGWSDDPGSFWGQKSGSLFAAVNCAMRWKYTHDATYAAKVYPYLKGVADFWNGYLTLTNNQYVDYNDSVSENSGPDTNPSTTIAFIQLVYPALVQMSQVLNVDSSSRAGWNDVIARLSPLTIVPASSIGSINSLGAPYNSPGVNVIRDSSSGTDFPAPAVTVYQDHQYRGTSAGMNSTQTIYPGWDIGIESDPATLKAAYNTCWIAAEWYDNNDMCTFYPAAASAGYDPTQILSNMDAMLVYHRFNNFMLNPGGGGTENLTTVPAGLAAMFLQSYQTNVHIFPNWPANQSAAFGNLNACGGFLVSSAITLGSANYVQIQSTAGQPLKLANPWPGAAVQCVSSINGTSTLSGAVLNVQTQVGEVLTLTSKAAVSLAAPTNLTGATNGSSVALSWNAVTGAAGYNVKRSSTPGGPFLTIAPGISAATYTDPAGANQTYYYAVSAIAPGAESADSEIIYATTLASAAIANSSFESPMVSDGNYESTSLPGWKWSTFGNALYAIVNPGGPSSSEPWSTASPAGVDGLNFAQIFVYGPNGGGVIYQDTGVKFQPGITYALTAAFGQQFAASPQTLASNSVFGLYNSSLSPIATGSVSRANLTAGSFTDQSLSYTATGTEAAGSGAYGTAGDIIIAFSVSGSAAQSYLDFDNVRLTTIAPTFSAYQQHYFTPAQLQNSAISGPLGDANGDGVSNLMACALGLSPWADASGSLPKAVAQGGYLTISYPQSKAAADWTMTVEVSSDMVTWYSGPAYTTQTAVTPLDGTRNLITVTDNTPVSASSTRFMRVRVTLP